MNKKSLTIIGTIIIDNPTWSQYDIIRYYSSPHDCTQPSQSHSCGNTQYRCKIDTKTHEVLFLKNGRNVCEPIKYYPLLSSHYLFKNGKAACECSFTLRYTHHSTTRHSSCLLICLQVGKIRNKNSTVRLMLEM